MARESQFVDYEQGAAEDLALMSSDSEVSRPGGSRRRLAAAGLLGTALLLGLVAIVARSPAPSRGVRHGVVVTLDQVPTPAKCVANGEDCGHVGCCSEAGMQCYKKNDYWASCNATCSSEPDANGEVWDCDAIGTRASPAGKGGGAPAAAPAQCIADVPLRKLAGAAPKNSTGAAVAKPKAQPEGNPCSWEGENCIESKCCRRQGFKCYMKSEGTGWAGCNAECTPGPHPEWGDDDPWSCDVLGESYQLPHIEAAPAAEAAGTSLFCFVVYTPDGVVRPGTGKSIQSGYEKTLVESMKTNGVGIYECDAAATFLGQRVPEGDWKSVVNTDIFLKVWQQVKADGTYASHDWTVKVDADAVFFPDRLKAHLTALRPPKDTPIYLKNINFEFKFQGALEVVSKTAADMYIAQGGECAKHVGINGGEDLFMMQCMDALGIGHMTDTQLLNDKYVQGEGWHLWDVNPCQDTCAVAFHPYKATGSWMDCRAVSMGQKSVSDFVGCDCRFPGDTCSLTSTKCH